jgi:mandelamide amidase
MSSRQAAIPALAAALVFAAAIDGAPARPPASADARPEPPSVVNKALFAAAPASQSDVGLVSVSSELVRRFAVTLTAREALQAMEQELITSREYVDLLIERIESHPEINAVIAMDAEGARAAADRADATRAAGDPVGPLHGLPILVKDAIFTEDFPTTAGTPALAGFEPDFNAPVLQTLIDAGAIVVGKTNVHELQIGYTTNNAFTGPTRNPYDPERMPGGSSGGNSAALAARLAPLTLGEDTQGSVRVPAAMTGTYGFRPTTGRYSTEGVVPLSSTADTLGPMARDVRDLALADAVITGVPNELEHVAVSELRIGVPGGLLREGLAFPVEWHFQRALRRLERAGATLVEADIPGVGPDSLSAFSAITAFETPVELTAFLEDNDIGVTLEQLVGSIATPSLAAALQGLLAEPVPEPVYNDVIDNALPAFRAGYAQYLEANDLDAVIYPTAPAPPAPIDRLPLVEFGGEDIPAFDLYGRQAHLAPLMGAPAVSVPLGQQASQVPAGGLDIMGAPGSDRRTLAIAHAIAQILPRVRPPLPIRPLPFQI